MKKYTLEEVKKYLKRQSLIIRVLKSLRKNEPKIQYYAPDEIISDIVNYPLP